MRIIRPNLLNLVDLEPDTLIHLVVEQRVEHLVEVHFGRPLNLLHILIQSCEEIVQEVLVGRTDIRRTTLNNSRRLGHHEHIVVVDAVLSQLLIIFFQLLISKENGLVVYGDARFDFEEALEVLDSHVLVDLEIVELVLAGQVLDQQFHGLLLAILHCIYER